MKITLINPPFLFPCKTEIVPSQCLGLRNISAYLKVKGNHSIQFIDALLLGLRQVRKYANGYIVGLTISEIISRINYDADFVGISAPFSQLAPIVHELATAIKTRLPHAKVIMGGVYPSTSPELAITSNVDYIIKGEGEYALNQILLGANPIELSGVYSKDSILSEIAAPAQTVQNLDEFPFPDYAIPQINSYFDYSPRAETGRTASLFTSRGCPFACEFCSIHPVYGRTYRARSAEKVLEEIEYINRKFNIQTIEFEDDNFTLQKERTAKILEGIIYLNERGANLGWTTPNGLRIDTLDESIIKLMKQSNCRSVALALEHGDPHMLKIMNKNLDLEKAFETIKLFIKYDIPRISLFVIVGYPGETRDCFEKSLSYLKKVKELKGNMAVSVHIAQPYPGTPLFKRMRAEGIITDPNLGNFLIRKDLMGTGHYVPIITKDFDAVEVLRRKEEIASVLEPRLKFLVKKYLPWAVRAIRFLKRLRSLRLNMNFSRTFNNKGYVILMYHRLIDGHEWKRQIPQSMFVRLSDFRRQIRYIQKYYSLISVSEIVDRIARKQPADRLFVAITFDDGYRDNFLLGEQILKEYNFKATIFVSTSYVEYRNLIPYWDKLREFAMNNSKIIEASDFKGRRYKFDLKNQKEKERFFHILCRWYYQNSCFAQQKIEEIFNKNNFSSGKENDFFSWDLLRQAMANGYFFIGSHTLTHSVLAQLSDQGWKEISQSKGILEEKLQLPVKLFSFPFGGPNAINDDIVNGVKKAGYAAAFTNDIGINDDLTPIYYLKRIPVSGKDSFRRFKLKLLCADWLSRFNQFKGQLKRCFIN